MNREVFTTNGIYPFSYVTKVFRIGNQVLVPVSTLPVVTHGSVDSFFAATLGQENYDRHHKLLKIGSTVK